MIRCDSFIFLGATGDNLPSDVDVVFCRDVLFHLSHVDMIATLQDIKQWNVRYLIATNVSPLDENVDTFTHGLRPTDLQLL